MLTNSIEALKELRGKLELMELDSFEECIHHPKYCEGQSDTVQSVLEAIDEMIERFI